MVKHKQKQSKEHPNRLPASVLQRFIMSFKIKRHSLLNAGIEDTGLQYNNLRSALLHAVFPVIQHYTVNESFNNINLIKSYSKRLNDITDFLLYCTQFRRYLSREELTNLKNHHIQLQQEGKVFSNFVPPYEFRPGDDYGYKFFYIDKNNQFKIGLHQLTEYVYTGKYPTGLNDCSHIFHKNLSSEKGSTTIENTQVNSSRNDCPVFEIFVYPRKLLFYYTRLSVTEISFFVLSRNYNIVIF